MIEGLRVFPAYQDARQKGTVIGRSCEECMRVLSVEARQTIGCGFEPAIAGAVSWTPTSWVERGLKTTVCPGYSSGLPAVREVVDAFVQWEAGSLTDFLCGVPATPEALQLFMYFRAGVREFELEQLRNRPPAGSA